MLTGKRAFDGETVSETIASVIKDEPDWSVLPAGRSAGHSRSAETLPNQGCEAASTSYRRRAHRH